MQDMPFENEALAPAQPAPVPAVGAGQAAAGPQPAWVMIENGRYQPRRIRGSYLGRELG